MPEAEQLRRRGEAMTDALTIRELFLGSALDCLRRAEGEDAVRAAVSDARLEGPPSGMKKYPFKAFNDLRTVVADRLAPSAGGHEEVIASIGGFAVQVSFESLAGRTMMMALAGGVDVRIRIEQPSLGDYDLHIAW